ncbi:hypothetical protein [Kordia sp.]|uniref:hypothetical protein n=1 Tax=Kordia sp. TaxID=1965332 RepID=UPI003D6B49BA
MRTIKTYSEEILKKYEEKGVLLEPTRTDIKDKCIVRFLEGSHVKDEEFLRLFFKVNREEDLLKIIESTDPEKFRTVQNFLLRNTGSTSRKNLNLIAWLIDFQPRPYALYRMQEIQSKKEEKGNTAGDLETTTIDKPLTSTKENAPKVDEFNSEVTIYSKKRYWIAVSFMIFCMFLFYGVYNFTPQKKTANEENFQKEAHMTDTRQQCMAWNGETYEITDCTYSAHPQYRTKVIVYDSFIQKNLKKVEVSIKTHFFAADTETPLIWYYKIRLNTYEYFTAKAVHPIYGDSLKKITKYHIENHIPKYKNEEKSFLKED